jgi:hypothetical protein
MAGNPRLSQQALAAMDIAGEPSTPPPSGIIANSEWIVLTVAGNSKAPITINDMTVVRSCQKPLSGGALFYSPTAGAGPFAVSPILFNLDRPISVGQYYPGERSSKPAGGNFFAKEVITLHYQEPQTLAVFVTATQYCRFSFNLDLATVNGPAVQRITDNGHPFSITSDGEPNLFSRSSSHVSFTSYATVYAGGVADSQHNGKFIRVSPSSYKGSGDPASFAAP